MAASPNNFVDGQVHPFRADGKDIGDPPALEPGGEVTKIGTPLVGHVGAIPRVACHRRPQAYRRGGPMYSRVAVVNAAKTRDLIARIPGYCVNPFVSKMGKNWPEGAGSEVNLE
jgi:hypothetical protein